LSVTREVMNTSFVDERISETPGHVIYKGKMADGRAEMQQRPIDREYNGSGQRLSYGVMGYRGNLSRRCIGQSDGAECEVMHFRNLPPQRPTRNCTSSSR
jgi:hypothetical protein